MQKEKIAKLLLEVRAVTLNPKKPYRYTSGILSPIYCDNRLIMSCSDKRRKITRAFLGLVREKKLKFDVVAGVATSGIPYAAWLSEALKKPMIYVRSSAKGYGKGNKIEGSIKARQKALVVEDLISTGGSSLAVGLALREAKARTTDCVAIFNYQMKEAEQQFKEAGIKLHALTDFSTLMDVAVKEKYISNDEKNIALAWNQDPAGWGKAMGYE